jgi:hypothetical protein
MKTRSLALMVVLLFASAGLQAQKAVVKGKPSLQDRFPRKSGNLLFSDMSLSLPGLFDNQVARDTFRIYNSAAYEIRITPPENREFVTFTAGQTALRPKEETYLAVMYTAAKRNDYGVVIDFFSMATTDSLTPSKELILSTFIEPYFGKMTAQDSSEAPRLALEDSAFDYHTIRQGEIVRKDIRFTNNGKRDLKILAVKPSCGCIGATVENKVLAPGESTLMHASLNSAGKIGYDNHDIWIFTNDPYRPRIQFQVRGTVNP